MSKWKNFFARFLKEKKHCFLCGTDKMGDDAAVIEYQLWDENHKPVNFPVDICTKCADDMDPEKAKNEPV
jgi:hypothetical protein